MITAATAIAIRFTRRHSQARCRLSSTSASRAARSESVNSLSGGRVSDTSDRGLGSAAAVGVSRRCPAHPDERSNHVRMRENQFDKTLHISPLLIINHGINLLGISHHGSTCKMLLLTKALRALHSESIICDGFQPPVGPTVTCPHLQVLSIRSGRGESDTHGQGQSCDRKPIRSRSVDVKRY
jgi:hypothetical protein